MGNGIDEIEVPRLFSMCNGSTRRIDGGKEGPCSVCDTYNEAETVSKPAPDAKANALRIARCRRKLRKSYDKEKKKIFRNDDVA